MKKLFLSILLLSALMCGSTALQASPSGDALEKEVADLSSQGKLDEAEALLLKAIKVSPDPARDYYLLGKIAEQRGDMVQASAYFKHGITIHEQGRR